MKILWILVIGGIVGWLANTILKRGEKGFLRNLLLGMGGAFVGNLVMRMLGFGSPSNLMGTLFSGLLGAVLIVWAIDKLRG
ncbi:MAG: GlsB/YeaQ/YmgE family stress response membrane protein [Flavobacteriales bacterium]|nr:GlsB/YeaQ/YmgE family stress response membrane protein [Flavobacteriales bacterium]